MVLALADDPPVLLAAVTVSPTVLPPIALPPAALPPTTLPPVVYLLRNVFTVYGSFK